MSSQESAGARRKFLYRGYDLDQLMRMKLDEFILILPSRQRRSLKRGIPLRHKKFIKKLKKAKRAKQKGKDLIMRTHHRDLIIFPWFIGLTIAVHNGRDFVEVKITPNHIGHYLGEFSIPQKRVQHGTPGVGATKSSKFVPLK